MLDIEACPGSGKTTLLVAKLAVLANRWKSREQGICVLSHTNAARTEIGERLSSTSAAHSLLRRPHFVGTIHSFVNEFLALPWLRSTSRPIKAIDTELALRDRWYRLPRGTRTYLENQHDGYSSLTYTSTDYSGGGKEAYPKEKDTYLKMQNACRASTEAGYYCFDEMFVWASDLLERFPDVFSFIRSRFPVVFIDEVQDNSELQSAFLHRLFVAGGTPVVRQRFGDSNQAIYHRAGASGAVTDTFPGERRADLPNSFRFGQSIADLAAPLGIRPQALCGLGPTAMRITHEIVPNVLFLFDNASALGVLPAYAKYLIGSFSEEALARGDFTAIAGVHRSDKDDNLPRFLGHYAPDYDPDVAGRQPKLGSLVQYLERARLELSTSRNIQPIINYFASGSLHLLRLAGDEVPFTLPISAHRYLLQKIPNELARDIYLELIDLFIITRCNLSPNDWTEQVVEVVTAIAEAILGREITGKLVTDFLIWHESPLCSDSVEKATKSINRFQYPPDQPQVSIRLASIHAVKGETHTATLVLESYNRTHHLKKLLPWLVGKRPKLGSDNTGEDSALIDRLKLHYVAMTRPSHLLCLAMRTDSFKPAQIELIRKRNWKVIKCENP